MSNSKLRNCFKIHVLVNNVGVCITWGLVAVGLAISITEAKAEYPVNVADVLEVAVADVPELRHRAAVEIGGNVSLPLDETLTVAGFPLSQIRARIGTALVAKVFRRRTVDGREVVS